jgi:para-nitrobenzyl esterase
VTFSHSEPALFLSRRQFLLRNSLTMAGAASLKPRLGFGQKSVTEYVEVKTAFGRLRGLREGDVITFKGVPYAGSVSGANRYKAAPPLQGWTGTKDALQLGAPSCQPGNGYYGINEPSPDENCLFLNIWTPAVDGRRRPVMFYNHGGGFYKGSGGAVYQDGRNLARTYDVVVVTTNHRLGLLGYLFLCDLGGEEYATSGNQGMLDIKDGLKWVHENIEAFGGDRNNVMVFGESGGGLKTSALYALPAADKYFHKASIESGPGICMVPRDVAAKTTWMTLKHLGLDKSEWRKLLDISVDRLLAAQLAVGQWKGGPFPLADLRRGNGWMLSGNFSPVVDGNVLPRDPFDPEAPTISKDKPLMVGTNRDEMAFMWFQMKSNDVFNLNDETLKARLGRELNSHAGEVFTIYRKSRPGAPAPDLYTAIMTDCIFWLPSVRIAERKYSQRGAPVYMYMFTHQSNFIIPGTNHPLGAAHALEIPYKFDNIHPIDQTKQADAPPPASMSVWTRDQ